MKIQNKKPKIVTTMMTSMIIGLVLLSPTTIMPTVHASSGQIDEACIKSVQKMEADKDMLVDETKAKNLASTNSQFAALTSGYVYKFDSIFNNWTVNKADCSLTWNSINAVYHLYDSKGNYAYNLVFSLDPQLTQVTKVDEYKPVFATYGSSTSPNWAGYEFGANSAHTTNVYEAYFQFNQPSVSQPTSGPNCVSKACWLVVWDGLEDSLGAGDGNLAQTGSGAEISCSSPTSCHTTYSLWYEFLPSGITICSTNVSPGDSIYPSITNDVIKGGSSANYDVSTTDSNSGASCSTQVPYSQMRSPTLASFINERVCETNCTPPGPTTVYYSLPKYSSDTIAGSVYYSGALTSIYQPWSSGNYYTWTMTNSGTTNISNGAVNNFGIFTETWSSSQGT